MIHENVREALISKSAQRCDLSGISSPEINSRQSLLNGVLVDFAHISPGGNILDLGAGAQGCYESVPKDASYYGVDISELSLRAHVSNNTVCADAMSLPFKGNSIDYVLSVMSFDNYLATRDVITEIRRVLVDSGRFLIASNGISYWNTKMILYGLDSDNNTVLKESELVQLQRFFRNQGICPSEYISLLSEQLLGLRLEELEEIKNEIIPCKNLSKKDRNSARNRFRRSIQDLYFETIDAQLGNQGFRPTKKGLTYMYEKPDESWDVSDVFDMPYDMPLSQIYAQCRGNQIVPNKQVLRVEKAIYLPVGIYEKV